MPLPFKTPPPRHRRTHTTPPTPAPAVVHVVVSASGDGRFDWIFDVPFDDAGSGSWTAADFAGLTVDGAAPVGIDSVIGADGDLTLLYPFDTGSTFHAAATPAKLHFDVGPATIVPANGPVD